MLTGSHHILHGLVVGQFPLSTFGKQNGFWSRPRDRRVHALQGANSFLPKLILRYLHTTTHSQFTSTPRLRYILLSRPPYLDTNNTQSTHTQCRSGVQNFPEAALQQILVQTINCAQRHRKHLNKHIRKKHQERIAHHKTLRRTISPHHRSSLDRQLQMHQQTDLSIMEVMALVPVRLCDSNLPRLAMEAARRELQARR